MAAKKRPVVAMAKSPKEAKFQLRVARKIMRKRRAVLRALGKA